MVSLRRVIVSSDESLFSQKTLRAFWVDEVEVAIVIIFLVFFCERMMMFD